MDLHEENVTKDHQRKNILLLFTNQAKTLAGNVVKIQLHTERIKQSCRKPGTAGEVHKSLLFAKANELKKLAELHNTAAKHLLRMADKLANGAPVDDIMAKMRIYCIFLADQLKSGENEVCNVLNMLLKDFPKSTSG